MLVRLSCLALTAILLAPIARAGVWVVDIAGGPGSDFGSIQGAVDAAVDGDFVLVRSGTYAPFTISDKRLHLLADVGASVVVNGTSQIENLSAGKPVVIDGLAFQFSPTTLQIEQCAAPVLLHDVTAPKPPGGALIIPFTRLFVADSASVTLVRCDVSTNSGALIGQATAVQAFDSNLAFFDCNMTGSDAHTSTGGPVKGGTGGAFSGGAVYVSGSSFLGGTGSEAVYHGQPFETCTNHGDGGDGMIFTAPSQLTRLASTITGGSYGDPLTAFCATSAAHGEAIVGPATVSTLSISSARTQELTSPMRDGEILTATYQGEPGDLVIALYSPTLAPTPFLPVTNGPILPDLFSLYSDVLGPVDAAGELTANFAVSFPHAGAAASVIVQGLFLTGGGEAVVSGAESLVYLGPGL